MLKGRARKLNCLGLNPPSATNHMTLGKALDPSKHQPSHV